MPRVRTVPKAAAEIRAADPNTFITESLLRRWIADGYVKLVPGCRTYKLVDLDQIETFIAENCTA